MWIQTKNATAAPATATTITIGFAAVESIYNNKVFVAGGVQAGAARSLPMQLMGGTTAVTVGSGGIAVAGTAAHSAASSGNPVRVGGRTVPTTAATTDTTLVAGDAADIPCSTGNQVIIKQFATREVDWSYVAPASGLVNTTTAVTIKAASGTASVTNYITGIQITWDGGTASELAIRDGAGGTPFWRIKLPTTAGSYSFTFQTPLRQPTANTLAEVVTLTATGAAGFVYFNAQGYVGF